MSTIALGKGVIDIESIYNALVAVGFDGYSTLEIAGEDAVKESYEFLKKLGAI
jgi:inosose dehydratase